MRFPAKTNPPIADQFMAGDLQQVAFNSELIARYDGKGPRYTSYPTADRFGTAFTESDFRAALTCETPSSIAQTLSLYFHLPFCNTICYYCACNKIVTKDHTRADAYLDSLEQELALHSAMAGCHRKVSQLHLGGGSPTFLDSAQMHRLLAMIRRHFDLQADGEYAIEIDPRDINPEYVDMLAGLGFNRMSIGIQDFDSAVQKAVNRIQSEEGTRQIIDAARAAGFKSISVDLIYGLPLQTPASLQQTLDRVLTLRPDRFAIYNFAHLPERFPPQRRIHAEDLSSPADKLLMLEQSIAKLTQAGYVYIGMDHFALPDDDLAVAQRRGQLHRNFQGYSTYADCDIIGFGVSAISRVGCCYSQNNKDLAQYEALVRDGHLPVERGCRMDRDDLLRRAVIQALMCQFELAFQPFELTYLIDFHQYFAEELVLLAPLEADGLVQIDVDGITVLPQGRVLVRSVAKVFDRYLRTGQTQAKFSRLI